MSAPKQPLQEAIGRLEQAFKPESANDSAPVPLEHAMRMAEALLFAGGAPIKAPDLVAKLGPGVDVAQVLMRLKALYAGRGVELVETGAGWRFQTAADLKHLFSETRAQPKRLPKAALETLAVIAYHQPVTRGEIEDIRGVSLSKGSLDLLLELNWVRPRGRRRSPGRPLTYGTTDHFLSHFGLVSLDALPSKEDLKAVGLVDARLATAFDVPRPSADMAADEDPLTGADGAEADFFTEYMDGEPGK
jgi:segregation and condensation protein B